MILETRAAPPFMKNGFVIGCEETREGVLIDPGDDVEDLLDAVATHRLAVRYILLTHAHLDHITGVGRAKAALGVPVGLHRDDDFLYEAVVQQGQASAFASSRSRRSIVSTTARPWRFGNYGAWVHHTPGHCPAACAWRSAGPDSPTRTLFVGDTLFAGSIGRTDLPGGDLPTLLRSIREVLFSFPDDTAVHSGHGEPTTIGKERRTNPFLNERS